MTNDGSARPTSPWPLPKFQFQVTWDGGQMTFQEVSGLDNEAQVIEYRHGNARETAVTKMPGLMKHGNISLKKGVMVKGTALMDWFTSIKMNSIKRMPLTISLLDESGAPTMVWTVHNAFPVKISGTDLKAEGNEVAIETIEIAHEGITIEST